MSIIKQIIKCPVCNRIIAKDSKTCNVCEQFNPEKINESEYNSYTLIDFCPDTIENKVTFAKTKQKKFTTQLFANSVFPWFYEKLLPPFWAMGLRGLGGIERESLAVIEFFGQDLQIVMDLSCGTGIMARQLAQRQCYELIIALDYSKSMLAMLKKQIDLAKITTSKNFVIIRGDAQSIPLISNSVDAIYAGAAMHCWENPQRGIEQIYRVLRTGGKLFATTFIKFLPSQKVYFFSIEELQQIFQEVGFQKKSLAIKVEGIYATISCIK